MEEGEIKKAYGRRKKNTFVNCIIVNAYFAIMHLICTLSLTILGECSSHSVGPWKLPQ